MIKAIVIDVHHGRVLEVNLNQVNCLEAMQAIVGGYIERAYELPNGDDLYVNEEGLINSTVEFFAINGARQPFAGCGVIVSHSPRGDTQSAKSTVSDIEKLVTFFDRQTLEVMFRGTRGGP